MPVTPRLFCFGFGYSARALADRLRPRGWRIAGTTRDPGKQAALERLGVESVPFAGEGPLESAGTALAGTTHLLLSAPPSEDGDPVLRHHAEDLVALPGLRWVGYLSTTGVYGDSAGGWVDEEAPVAPSGPRGRRRAEAEAGWLALWRRHGLPVHLFRLAGIYGPGRNQLEALRAGTAKRIVKPGQVFSRIHVEDIAAVLEASIDRPDPGRAYNVCDDLPDDPCRVVEEAARLLGVAPPPLTPFEAADLSPMARSFYADSRRVSNRRIREELGVALRYPTYREGLRALLQTLSPQTPPPQTPPPQTPPPQTPPPQTLPDAKS